MHSAVYDVLQQSFLFAAIGRKLKLISCDDSIGMGCAYPAITAILQHFYQMGDLAMKKLFNMMRGCKENTEYIKRELIVRASTRSQN